MCVLSRIVAFASSRGFLGLPAGIISPPKNR
jgi:hypothetical protein